MLRKILIIAIGMILGALSPVLAQLPDLKQLTQAQNYVPKPAVIAHRGTTYWAPEETEAAFRWARNMGADYLEADLQLSQDGTILTLHDHNLCRTTDIATIYPDRADNPAITFTYRELLRLDAGSWFNKKYPARARKSYQGLEILTLEDLIKIAEGYRIERDRQNHRVIHTDGSFAYVKDEADNGNRPGIYLEFKEPEFNPDIEKRVKQELSRLGWNVMQTPATSQLWYKGGRVNVGHTNGKVVLQTFSEESLIRIENLFRGKLPTTFLIPWDPSQVFLALPSSLKNKVLFAKKHGAQFVGPSIAADKVGKYASSWLHQLLFKQSTWIHDQRLKLHPYTFDTAIQMENWFPYVDGVFTNRVDLALNFYKRKGLAQARPLLQDAKKILEKLGY
ncbi:MAG: glycerophosphodiester phosphodiesterase family protein [Neisseriaceae bacterium]